jgi:ABC-type antimicrobial peptide transport system ATPase subunit
MANMENFFITYLEEQYDSLYDYNERSDWVEKVLKDEDSVFDCCKELLDNYDFPIMLKNAIAEDVRWKYILEQMEAYVNEN